MADEKLFHVGVKALIKNDAGKYLVVETDTSKFLTAEQAHGDLIGGRIGNNQEPLEALAREIEEETGLTETGPPTFVTAVVSPMHIPITPTEKVGLLLMVYRVRIAEDANIVLSDEHTKFEWLDRRAAATALRYKFGKEFTDALRAGAWDD